MATTPTKNYYNPDLNKYTSSVNLTFTSTGNTSTSAVNNSMSYTGGSTVNKISVLYGTSAVIGSATELASYTSQVRAAKIAFTKSTTTRYLFFRFYNGTSSLGFVRFIFNTTTLPNGSYYVYIGGWTPSSSNVIKNIMIYSSSYTSNIVWDEYHSPIACTSDYSAGSSDTNKSVFIYDSSTGTGKATTSSNTTLTANFWTDVGFTHSYSNGQAIRYCDIKSVS